MSRFIVAASLPLALAGCVVGTVAETAMEPLVARLNEAGQGLLACLDFYGIQFFAPIVKSDDVGDAKVEGSFQSGVDLLVIP